MHKNIIQFGVSLFLLFHLSYISYSQDTLLLHYSNATVSEIYPTDTIQTAITGRGDEGSIGKYMYFDANLHRSPLTKVIALLFDLEVTNNSSLDSFTVFIEIINSNSIIDTWERKFAFSAISEESILIGSTRVAAYNFAIDLSDERIFDFGNISFNTGIKFDENNTERIAIKATGQNEFSDALNRCFTINEDEIISDFVTAYRAEIGLAIFPVTIFSSQSQEIESKEIKVRLSQNQIKVTNSNSWEKGTVFSLVSAKGEVISQKIKNYSDSITFDTHFLPSGIYYLNASNKKHRNTTPIHIP